MNNKIYTKKDLHNKTYTVLDNSVSANCSIFDYNLVNLRVNKTFFFIGSEWYGLDIAISNSLIAIASKHLNIKFLFRLVENEDEAREIIPSEIQYTHLPVILYMDKYLTYVISTGLINVKDLEIKIGNAIS